MVLISDFLPSDLCKPEKGVRHRALHHRGEADIVSDHHLIHGLHLEPVAVTVTVGSVDGLKVPALQRTEGN